MYSTPKNFHFVIIFMFLAFTVRAQKKEIEIAKLFNGTQGCFVISKFDNSEHYYFNKDQCSQPYSPCSTFKVPNSLIALETGVAPDTGFVIQWDSIRNPHEAWMDENEPFKHWCQDQTMQSALKYSVVWYYQEIARRIGEKSMQSAITELNYGNMDISSAIDRFWLCGSLQISAIDQTQFLRGLYNEKLKGFSIENMRKVKAIMLYKKGENYALYGKTGGGKCSPDHVIGWYVGFVETPRGPYVFAMNMLADDFTQFNNNRRITIVEQILKILGYI